MICLEPRPYWLTSKNTWKLKIVVNKQKETLGRHEYVYWFCTWKLDSVVICQFHLTLIPCTRGAIKSIPRGQGQTINTLISVRPHISISWFWKERKGIFNNLIKENRDRSVNSKNFVDVSSWSRRGEMWGLHSHCPWEKAMGSTLIYSIPGGFPTDSKSFLGIGSLQIRRWFCPAIRLGNRWCNQQRAISGSYKHKQSDSTHLGSWQPNELPAEAHSSTAATLHRPGTHSAAPEVSFFL